VIDNANVSVPSAALRNSVQGPISNLFHAHKDFTNNHNKPTNRVTMARVSPPPSAVVQIPDQCHQWSVLLSDHWDHPILIPLPTPHFTPLHPTHTRCHFTPGLSSRLPHFTPHLFAFFISRASVVGPAFPISAMTRDVGDHGDPYPSPHPSTRIPNGLYDPIPRPPRLARVSEGALVFASG
jgi:hypothetical protein